MAKKRKVIDFEKEKSEREARNSEETQPREVCMFQPMDGEVEDFQEELANDEVESMPDPDGFVEKLARVAKTIAVEREMYADSERIYMLANFVRSSWQKTGVDLYTTWRKGGGCYRLFFICFKCLWVWSPVVRKGEIPEPEKFCICPNGCNRERETYSVATSDIASKV